MADARPPASTPAAGAEPALLRSDPYLRPFGSHVRARLLRLHAKLAEIDRNEGSLDRFTAGHTRYGFNRAQQDGRPGLLYREWAPGADYVALVGDFNGWDRGAHPLAKDAFGVWSVFLPDQGGRPALEHGSRLKVHVYAKSGPEGGLDRIPAYARRVEFDERHNPTGVHWAPPEPYVWRHAAPPAPKAPRIYEAHTGMATEEHRVGTFAEFARDVLPRVAAAGYNTIQLMAVQEHPYYGSFGYHVSNFFAVSSRFGTPEDFKRLVDEAHGLGVRVIVDLVHSHAVKNVNEGLNRFDGTDHQYFHAGPKGEHPAWDSLLFDYRKWEVMRFLLSNVRFWLEEYQVDGFRFDGVTSMMYLDHGLGRVFTSYADYFPPHTDEDAILYLQLANTVARRARPDCTTVAEDVSGFPGIARPVVEGGVGFDYRLAMGIPDNWIKWLKELPDERWRVGDIWWVLINRRHGERHVAYAESHDQALVGDKTLAFWLMDADMYWHMDRASKGHPRIERGIALHKLIRLLTFSVGGEGYLTFMGNEFGHPEWIDFPREGNGYSYQHARRQWSLAKADYLRYADLAAFDRAMLALDDRFGTLSDPFIEQLFAHDDDHTLVYRRGPLVFAVNLHPTQSYADWRIPVPDPADYAIVLDTDAEPFGGLARTAADQTYWLQRTPHAGRAQSVQIYLPSRTAQVLAPVGLLSR